MPALRCVQSRIIACNYLTPQCRSISVASIFQQTAVAPNALAHADAENEPQSSSSFTAPQSSISSDRQDTEADEKPAAVSNVTIQVDKAPFTPSTGRRLRDGEVVANEEKLREGLDGAKSRLDSMQRELARITKVFKITNEETSNLRDRVHTQRTAIAQKQNRNTAYRAKIASQKREATRNKMRNLAYKAEIAQLKLHNQRTELTRKKDQNIAYKAQIADLEDQLNMQKEVIVNGSLRVIERLLSPLEDFHISKYAGSTVLDIPARLHHLWTLSNKGRHPRDVKKMQDSILRHNHLLERPDIVAVYADGSVLPIGAGGSAAVIPSLVTMRMQYLPTDKPPYAEAEAIVVALELAAKHAEPNKHVAIFTDSFNHARHTSHIWVEDKVGRNTRIKRASGALRELEKVGSGAGVYWLGSNEIIMGSRFAHLAARKAAYLSEPPYELEVNEESYKDTIKSSPFSTPEAVDSTSEFG